MISCGLDFGTSNSAIGVMRDGTAALAPVEAGNTLAPSAVFFDYETRNRVLFGNEAIAAYVGQTEGRLMRALKSILGGPLIDEETSLGGRKVPLREVVEIFIRHLKHKAEAVLEKLGITTSEAIAIFFNQIAMRKGMPFDVKIPNKTTRKAMRDARSGRSKRFSSTTALMEDLNA